jgi:hypothetical protein
MCNWRCTHPGAGYLGAPSPCPGVTRFIFFQVLSCVGGDEPQSSLVPGFQMGVRVGQSEVRGLSVRSSKLSPGDVGSESSFEGLPRFQCLKPITLSPHIATARSPAGPSNLSFTRWPTIALSASDLYSRLLKVTPRGVTIRMLFILFPRGDSCRARDEFLLSGQPDRIRLYFPPISIGCTWSSWIAIMR